jgi:glucan phosphoethanolaminetransferase (alkaline phosphatase superfamily)
MPQPPAPRSSPSWPFYFVGLHPWLAIVAVYAEALIIRIHFSRWPSMTLGDQPPSAALDNIAIGLSLLPFAMLPLILIVSVARRRKVLRERRYQIALVSYALGLLVLVLLIRFDPAGIWYWFLD